MKENNLTEGNLLKTLLTFAVPFLIANILQSLYGAVDLFVVGQYCNAESVAAVSTGTQVTQIVTSLITGLTLGSTILIGEGMGSQRYDLVKQTIGTTLTVFAIVALCLTALMLGFERPLLMLLKTPEESFGLTMEYVAVCSAGNLFICGYNAISAILRGYGDSTRPMMFVGLSCTINIILDFVLVKYWGMGVSGTALATVISQAVSMVIAIIYLKQKNFIFDFKLPSFRPVWAVVKKLARVGIPISFQELMVRISFLYLMTVMNRCGVYAASVVGISSKYDVFAMLTATSMANALAAITAQNMGAGKLERARRSLWYGLSFALFVSCLFWIWAQVSPQSMIRVFSQDDNVIAAGIPFFRSCSYDYVLVTIVFCLNGYLNGRQKTVWTMISCSAGALLLRIPMVYLFGTYFADDLGMLGRIAPTVSGIMACYTLAYVIYEGKQDGKKKEKQDGKQERNHKGQQRNAAHA
ncbi:MAG: MATE family efflux transporter [Lachnospiraceae bacterium]|nr:MATE family efflux transporter [Lachnospiraceae bacterium]